MYTLHPLWTYDFMWKEKMLYSLYASYCINQASGAAWSQVKPYKPDIHARKTERSGLWDSHRWQVCIYTPQDGWFFWTNQKHRESKLFIPYFGQEDVFQMTPFPNLLCGISWESDTVGVWRAKMYVFCFTYVYRWHLGDCQHQCMPTSRGFDHQYGIMQGAGDYYLHDHSKGFYVYYSITTTTTIVTAIKHIHCTVKSV